MQVQEFPKWKYHLTLPARVVKDPEQEANLGDGWFDHPDHVPPPEPEPEAEPQGEKPNGKPSRRYR